MVKLHRYTLNACALFTLKKSKSAYGCVEIFMYERLPTEKVLDPTDLEDLPMNTL